MNSRFMVIIANKNKMGVVLDNKKYVHRRLNFKRFDKNY